VDLTEFDKKMNAFQDRFGRLGQEVQDAGAQIGMAFGGVSLAIAGGLGVAVKKAADFEQGLSNIKAVSGATGEEMEQLKQLALDMGASTKYSATEAAQGIEELVKAGVSMTDITNGGLKGALSLATAGGLELAEAAEIASTALNAFRKDGLSVGQAADILAGAANASATSVGELKFGLASVSAVASSVGMSFEDTTTALALFAQNGLKGSDAGTSLKTMLMNLQPSTDKARALFEELGLVTADGASRFFDANGQLKSLDSIAGILQESMTGLTDAQRLQKMETIFGSDAIRAANILFKEGASGATNMKKAMSKVTAEQVAAEKLNNLNGAIEQLKGSFETFMISIGETLVPALKSAAKYLGKIVDWFNKLSPTTKKIITYFAAATMVLTGLVAVVAFSAVGMGFLAAAEWAVILPLLIIIGKIVLVIAALTALGAGIAYLYNKNETFRKGVTAMWNAIKTITMTVVNALLPVFKSIWATLKNNLLEAWAVIQPALASAWKTITEVFNSISKSINKNMETIKAIISFVFNYIGTYIKVALNVIFGILKIALNSFITLVRISFNSIKTVISSIFLAIKTTIKNAMAVISGIIKTVSAILKGDWSGAWQAIKDTVSTVMDNLKGFLMGMKTIFLDAGKGFIDALSDGIKGAAKNVYDTVKNVAKTIRDFLPFSPAKVGPLSDLDKLDFAGPISDSIIKGAPNVQANLNSMLQVPDVNPSVTADMSGGTTVIMQLDGRTLAKSTFAQMGGTFRLRGAVT
jgi:TP901 family phage tail tape measure protein